MLQSMLGVLVRVDIMWLMVKEMDAIGLCYLLIYRSVNVTMEIHLDGLCPQT